MKQVRGIVLSTLMLLLCGWLGQAQQSVATAGNGVVPPLIQFSNVATDEGGSSLSGVVSITFSLYNSQQGGEPLWVETQNNVQLDATGHYSVQLGITKPAGVPTTLFTTGEARWLGVRIDEQAEQSRVLLLSVPYALKAGDAETIGGLPPSAFLLAEPLTRAGGDRGTLSEGASSSVTSAAITGTGATDYIPLWTSTTNLGKSVLFQAASTDVGVGTTTPTAKLDVNGSGRVRGNLTGTTATFAANNAGNSVTVTQSNASGAGLISTAPFGALVGNATGGIGGGIGVEGNATFTGSGTTFGVEGNAASTSGIGVSGTSAGTSGVGVEGFVQGTSAIGIYGLAAAGGTNGIGVEGLATDTSGTGEPIGVEGQSSSSVGVGILGDATSTTGSTLGIQGIGASTTGIGIQGLSPNVGVEGNASTAGGSFPIGVWGVIDGSAGAAGVFDNPAYVLSTAREALCTGNLLVGRTTVGNALFGGLSLANTFRVDCTGKGYFDNGTQTGGADFAESVTVRGSRAQYAPGDLLVIDSRGKRRLALSQQAYSTRIAGIYSTKPGVLATPHKMDDPQLSQEVPLAVVGIVPCKVTAENGAIEVGDLLVASSKPGFAMKGTNRSRMLGAVVGKAMEPLQSNTGVIEVLVTLQ
jgi:hypothetical protein